jgi:hypothetical protein
MNFTKKYAAAIAIALATGFLIGKVTNPRPVKAAGLSYVVRVSPPGSTTTIPPLYGTPVSLSCSVDSCYVLTMQQ